MSKKRIADKQLTDRNWLDEEEPEEAGEFKRADDEVVKKRVIKTAKRRLPPGSGADEKPSLFSGFAGFGAPKLVATTTAENSNGASKPIFTSVSSSSTSSVATPDKPDNTDNNDVFLKKLKKLNESVLKFAKEHVEKNSFVILSSVFNDYERHLKRIRSSNGSTTATNADSTPVFSIASTTATTSEVTPSKPDKEENNEAAGKKDDVITESKPFFSFGSATGPSFSFGASSTTSTGEAGGGGFSFKLATSVADSSTAPSTGGFSFKPDSSTSGATSSLFGNPIGTGSSFTGFGGLVGSSTAAPAQSSTQEEEAEEPPKAEKVDHVDSEALYHIKCKLFIKSEEGWNEKGIGIANLKKCNDKVQLLIRNDTTMGTVILNTLLHDKMPISKSGKNGIMIVATNQDSKTETFLVRVNKDKQEEFFGKLEECKTSPPE